MNITTRKKMVNQQQYCNAKKDSLQSKLPNKTQININATEEVENVMWSFASHKMHRPWVVLIFVSLALSRTSAYTARP